MKKHLQVLHLLLITFLAVSCQKSSSNGYNPTMRATIDGTSFSVSGMSQVYSSSASSGGINYLYLSGDDAATGKKIKMTLMNVTGTGVIQFNTGSAAAYYYMGGSSSGFYSVALTGSVNLTSLTPNLEGTFSFTCADSTEITNGSFSMKAP